MFCACTWPPTCKSGHTWQPSNFMAFCKRGVLHPPNDVDTDHPLVAVLNLKVSKVLKAQVLLLSRPLGSLVTVSLCAQDCNCDKDGGLGGSEREGGGGAKGEVELRAMVPLKVGT